MRGISFALATIVTLASLSVSQPDLQPTRTSLFPREALPQVATAPPGDGGDPIRGDNDEDEPTSTSEEKKETKSGDKSDDDASKTKSGKEEEETDTKSDKDDDKKKTTAKPKSTKIPATAQVGGINMKSPNPTDGYKIFKIGETVSFRWNYTNLIASPTAINVEAYCTVGQNYFTITGNASADTTEVKWDTGKFQTSNAVKLPEATYTLIVYDANRSRTDVASPGHLGPFNQYSFGLYQPKPPVPWKDFECPYCTEDAANALANAYALQMTVIMVIFGSISFTWIIAGLRR